MRISKEAAEAIMGPAPAVRYEIIPIEQIAAICHEAIRQMQAMKTETHYASFHWEELAEATRQIEIERVMDMLNGGTAERKHKFWRHLRVEDGWKFGFERDVAAKTDPRLVAYADLPDEVKAKGLVFDGIVTALSDIYIHNHRGFMPDGTRIV